MKIRAYKSIMIELHKIISEMEVFEVTNEELEKYYEEQLTNIANELNMNKKYYDNYSMEKLKKYEEKLLDSGKNRAQYEQLRFIIKEKEIYDKKSNSIYKFQSTLQLCIAKDLFSKKKSPIKKTFITVSLALMVGVSSIAISKTIKGKNNNENSSAIVQQTTEKETTSSISTTQNKVTTEQAVIRNLNQFDINDSEEIENKVDEAYKKYKKAYKNMNISKNDIKNIIFLINNKIDSLTENELEQALYNIDQLYLPQDIKNTLVSIGNQKQGFAYDDERKSYELPRLSELVSYQYADKIEELKKIELSIKFVTSTLTMKTYGDVLVRDINNTVVLMETTEKNDDYNLETNNKGLYYLLVSARKNLVLYAMYLNPGENYIKYKKDGEHLMLQISETEEEMELKEKISRSIISNTPIDKEEMDKYTKNQNNLIGNKYEKKTKEIEKQLILENRKNNKFVKVN